MRKIFFSLLAYLSFTASTHADAGIFKGCVSTWELREGKIHIDDIPCVIQSATDFFLGLAGTISVIFVIVWAYKILFGSLQQDKTKWRDTIIAALGGFALAALAWFIIRFIIANFS